MSTPAKLDEARRDLARMSGCVGTVRGIATAAGLARGEENHPDAYRFKVPLPFFWNHEKAIGWVREATLVGDEWHVVAEVAERSDDPALAARLRFAWGEIAAGRAKALSIGPSRMDLLKGLGDRPHRVYGEIGEISACYAGANARARITHALRYEPPVTKRREPVGAIRL